MVVHPYMRKIRRVVWVIAVATATVAVIVAFTVLAGPAAYGGP